jgi:hypothetical protein
VLVLLRACGLTVVVEDSHLSIPDYSGRSCFQSFEVLRYVEHQCVLVGYEARQR